MTTEHIKYGFFSLALFVCTGFPQAQAIDETLAAFEKPERSGYVQPFATTFGSLFNSGWNQSARVGEKFGFFVGMPIVLTYISKDDHTYERSYATGCAQARAVNAASNCPEADYNSLTVPTIFGPGTSVPFYTYNLDANGNVSSRNNVEDSDTGIKSVRDIAAYPLPFLFPQVGFSWYYTELKLRYMMIPSIGVSGQSFGASVFGLGLQHDLRSFLSKLENPFLQKMPFDVSVAVAWTFWSLDWKPGDNFTGSLELSGLTSTTSLVLGKRWSFFEIFSEIGWETSSFSSGGALVKTSTDEFGAATTENIDPVIEVDGRNGFRLSLNMAFHWGYHPVLSYGYGAQNSNAINLFGYKKEGE